VSRKNDFCFDDLHFFWINHLILEIKKSGTHRVLEKNLNHTSSFSLQSKKAEIMATGVF
jgi:hypothetical protein